MAEAITDGIAAAVSLFTNAGTAIMGNEIAMAFVGATLLGAGIGLFRRVVGRR